VFHPSLQVPGFGYREVTGQLQVPTIFYPPTQSCAGARAGFDMADLRIKILEVLWLGSLIYIL
jgi:hypothetical protein